MPETQTDLTQVLAETFDGAEIILDGHAYSDCTFIDCTFVWDGGHYAVSKCRLFGRRNVRLNHQTAADTVDLLKMLGLFNDEFAQSWARG
jgi:hypothetical protein